MGFKFGKCKQLTTLKEQSLATTAPDFIDFEGCDALTELKGATTTNSYGALNNTKAVTISFKNCANLTTHGAYMFGPSSQGGSMLESVDFTGCIGLTSIGSYCFTQSTNAHCDKITKIDLSPCINLETIGIWFCPSCTELTEIDMHGLTKLTSFSGANQDSEADSLSRGASRCNKLTKVDMSNCSSLTYIGSGAFAMCHALTNVNLTGCSSLQYLRRSCFQMDRSGTSALETIDGWEEIKHNITYIGHRAFDSCTKLVLDISHMENLRTIAYGASSDIGYGAFARCTSMHSCPNNCPSLATIGAYAFYQCTNLGLQDDGTFVTLDLSHNANLTTIGTSAFDGVKAIETINLDEDTSLATLGNRCFYSNTALKHFYARNCISLTSVGEAMLTDATKLLEIRFDGCQQLATFKKDAFRNLQSLICFTLPINTIKTIGATCFYYAGHTSLKGLTYDKWKEKLTELQVEAGIINAGDECILFDITSNIMNNINDASFYYSTLIHDVNFDDSESFRINQQTNFSNASVHSISMNNCPLITNIPTQFAGRAQHLEYVYLNNTNVNYINTDAFRECSMLKIFECDKTKITGVSDYAFYLTTRADAVAYDWPCQPLTNMGQYAFHKSTLIKSITTAGGTATKIGKSFAGFAPNLETVSITNMEGMTSIDNEAFIQCPKLQSCDFSGCTALNNIGAKAFQIDSQMTECKIQNSPIATIGDYAFMSCLRLENFNADSSVIKSIGVQAFEYCTSFKTFKIHQDDTQAVSFSRSCFAGWRNAASGLVPPTYPLDIYIYGLTPGDVAGDTNWNFVNGINNNGCQITIHFNADAEDDYKQIAQHKEDVAHARTTTDPQTGKDVVWYWCCSNGQVTATTGGTTPVEGNFQCAGWYATTVATTPTVVFDL